MLIVILILLALLPWLALAIAERLQLRRLARHRAQMLDAYINLFTNILISRERLK